MKNTLYDRSGGHSGEWLGDLIAWQRENSADNSEQLARILQKLRLAREEVLTPRQQELLSMHFDQEMSVTQIARELGICHSSVSRTIATAKERLRRCLKYLL